MEKIKNLILAMRPPQWTKNFILFAGLIFSLQFFNIRDILLSLYGFFLYCTLAGSIYIINDIMDMEKDRLHPVKCKRPLAAGKVTKTEGFIFSFTLAGLSLFISFLININFFFLCLTYFIFNIIYSLYLKKIVILDVLSIAISFVLRGASGAVIINVLISPWLLVCTFLLALFMALGKRRGEIVLLDKDHGKHREVLSRYGINLLDQMISVVTSSLLIAYSLYTFNSGRSTMLMGTIPFVLYGIFRYLYLVYEENKGGNPTSIFISDRPLQINMILWMVLVFIIIYWRELEELRGKAFL